MTLWFRVGAVHHIDAMRSDLTIDGHKAPKGNVVEHKG